MHEPDRYPPGVPCWIEATAPDPTAAAEFYGSLFDWSIGDARGNGWIAQREGLDVAGIAADPGEAAWLTYVRVDDVDAASARVTEGAGRVTGPVVDVEQIARTVQVADPADAVLGLWEPIDHGGAQLVNGPGTWNWSNLTAADPKAAIEFYGDVFGWEAMPMGEDVWMWRMPGYGDLLAERDPALRARHAEPGIPPGFSDAIAWLTPAPSKDASGWTVTFAVDDTDDAAARAESLGATIVGPAREEGPTRVADLRDPQGATFTISHYAGA